MRKPNTEFKRDVIEAIRGGCDETPKIKSYLLFHGRRVVSDDRLDVALGALRNAGIIRTSMAGKHFIVGPVK